MKSDVSPNLPINLDRRFQTWRYGVGHSLLALRSPKPEYDTNVDVVFHGVKLMLLAPLYERLALRSATDQELAWIASIVGYFATDQGEVVVIGSDEMRGLVWCTGGWWIDENDLDYQVLPQIFTAPPSATDMWSP